MLNPRMYGEGPYNVAVVHGGPGAPGSIAPVARELSTICGVLEPFQTATTLDGQVEELKEILENYGNLPVILIGWSHGAGLSTLLTARYPGMIRKLILIGTTPFDAKYQDQIIRDRLLRLVEDERAEFFTLTEIILNPEKENRNEAMARLFRLLTRSEYFKQLSHPDDVLEYQPDINLSIGQEWRMLLTNNELLKIIPSIQCPVVAIHGDHDVNPAEAVRNQFSQVIKDFTFILLEKCGHNPWHEKYAVDKFYAILKEEILEKNKRNYERR